jgi:PIN domain nuclease of toxin-antitoxin system
MGTVGYLLDTHTFLWAIQKSVRLSKQARSIIEDIDAPIYLSAVSAYEIMYKYSIGKLPEYNEVAEDYFEFVKRLEVSELAINTRHTHFAGKLEWSHRDPFDRLLAAQAHVENLTLITSDPAFQTLPWVSVLW